MVSQRRTNTNRVSACNMHTHTHTCAIIKMHEEFMLQTKKPNATKVKHMNSVECDNSNCCHRAENSKRARITNFFLFSQKLVLSVWFWMDPKLRMGYWLRTQPCHSKGSLLNLSRTCKWCLLHAVIPVITRKKYPTLWC